MIHMLPDAAYSNAFFINSRSHFYALQSLCTPTPFLKISHVAAASGSTPHGKVPPRHFVFFL